VDFIDSTPFRFVSTVDLTITPEQVFEVLNDADSLAAMGNGGHQGDVDQPATARRRHHPDRRHARRHYWR
jgi:hypothetical protein